MTREMRAIIEILKPHPQNHAFFFRLFEHVIRGKAVYAGKFNSMVGIYLHDGKESDMVCLFDGNSHGVS